LDEQQTPMDQQRFEIFLNIVKWNSNFIEMQ
jgi:hypothetical protein